MEICVNEWAEPPEGTPVWCVAPEVTWQTGLQFVGECILLLLIFLASHRFFTYYKTRKAQKRWEREQLNKKADQDRVWHP